MGRMWGGRYDVLRVEIDIVMEMKIFEIFQILSVSSFKDIRARGRMKSP
jgi:hypothetical protein